MTEPFVTTETPVADQDNPEVDVIIEPVNYDDTDAKYKDTDDDGSIFVDYRVFNHYEKDHHRYMLGISSPGGQPGVAQSIGVGGGTTPGASVAFVQLAMPTLLWISRWTVCQTAKEPTIPDPESVNPNWVLLDEGEQTVSLTIGPDGVTQIYRINGTYVYGHRNPSAKLNRDVVFALPPWLEDAFPRQIPDGNLAGNIIDLAAQNNAQAGGNTQQGGGDNAQFGGLGGDNARVVP